MKRKRHAANFIRRRFGKTFLKPNICSFCDAMERHFKDNYIPASIINYGKYMFPRFDETVGVCEAKFFGGKYRLTKADCVLYLQLGCLVN